MDRKSKATSARIPAPRSSSARFIAPMLLQRTDSLPDSPPGLYEFKLDGYRAIAFKRDGVVHLRSRNDNDFSGRYPGVVKGLAKMPDDTVIDGEVIAFDDDGRPSFNALQNYGSAQLRSSTYVFDVMVLAGRDVMREPLVKRRELLEPEAKSGRWGQGLTKAKMAECQWLKPVLVGQFEFLEWTGDNQLRHSKFVGLREDKKATDVVRE